MGLNFAQSTQYFLTKQTQKAHYGRIFAILTNLCLCSYDSKNRIPYSTPRAGRRLRTGEPRVLRETRALPGRSESGRKNRHGRPARALPQPGGLAAIGADRIPTLRHEHLHRPGMGRRQRGPGVVRPNRAGRGAMGAHAQRKRLQDGHPDGKAPRRLLPVAHENHHPLRGVLPMEKRERRCRPRIAGGLRQARHEIRRLPVAMGPQRPMLRGLAPLQ